MRLEHPDTLHLQAAQGWLELGNHLEANEELERITPELRGHPEVLEVRLEIYSHGKLWSSVVEVGNGLVPMLPKRWRIPYLLACACAQLGRLKESKLWFQKAIAMDEKTVRLKAIEDEDLKPLWDSMSGTLWKME